DQARLDLADILVRTHDVPEAVGHYEQLLRRQPGNREALVGLARCRAELGDTGEADRLLDRLLREHPDDVQALTERGRLGLNAGDGEEVRAEGWLGRVVGLDPASIEANCLLALSLRRAGKAAEAERHFAASKRFQADADRLEEIMNREMDRRPHEP